MTTWLRLRARHERLSTSALTMPGDATTSLILEHVRPVPVVCENAEHCLQRLLSRIASIVCVEARYPRHSAWKGPCCRDFKEVMAGG